jgi:hypothetical protein
VSEHACYGGFHLVFYGANEDERILIQRQQRNHAFATIHVDLVLPTFTRAGKPRKNPSLGDRFQKTTNQRAKLVSNLPVSPATLKGQKPGVPQKTFFFRND